MSDQEHKSEPEKVQREIKENICGVTETENINAEL